MFCVIAQVKFNKIEGCVSQNFQTFFFHYLFIFFQSEGKVGREGKTHQCVVVSSMPPTGDLTCNPGMCPRLGIKLATLLFAGPHSIHWATLARAQTFLFNVQLVFTKFHHTNFARMSLMRVSAQINFNVQFTHPNTSSLELSSKENSLHIHDNETS